MNKEKEKVVKFVKAGNFDPLTIMCILKEWPLYQWVFGNTTELLAMMPKLSPQHLMNIYGKYIQHDVIS
jgi:hypothetical protein